MRFLIFNMVVFLSIGYLFTAAPGQSVGNWIDATIDKVSRTVALTSPADAKKNGLTPADKLARLVVPTPLPVVPHNDDIKINGNTIQKIISDSVNNYLEEIGASLDGVQAEKTPSLPRTAATIAAPVEQTAPLPIDRASQTAVTGKTPDSIKQNTTSPKVIRAPADADALLASGFSELYPAEPKAVSTARDELAPQDTVAAPVFMNSGDRQAALSELIQTLQLTYLERAGQ
jgi:hypothetical protein